MGASLAKLGRGPAPAMRRNLSIVVGFGLRRSRDNPACSEG